jgi:regulator of replication initiation timing
MMSEDIKACPYCGSKDTKVSGWLGGSFGRCNSCGTTGPDADNESDAILLWNAAANQLAAKNAEIAEHRNHVAKIMQRENNMMKHNEKLRAEIEQLRNDLRIRDDGRTAISIGYIEAIKERDEARRVARRLYDERNAMSLGLDTIKRHVEKSIHDGVPITRLSILGICKAGLENLSYTRNEPPTSRVDATESDA